VDPGAALAGGIQGEVRADSFTLDGTLHIAGSAPVGTATGGFSTFVVSSSNVTFGAGSRVVFNTWLNDASVQRTDQLVINDGTVSGGPVPLVIQPGGSGGLTTGNGIRVVQALGSASTAGAFTLATASGPVPSIVVGPYVYELFYGSVDASDPQSWFLRSKLDCALDPGDPACSGGGGNATAVPTLSTPLLAVLMLLLGGMAAVFGRRGGMRRG
jgi:hypothetical protein